MHTDCQPMKCSNQVPTIVYQSSALNGKLQHLHSAVSPHAVSPHAVLQATTGNDPHSTRLSGGTTGASISGVSTEPNSTNFNSANSNSNGTSNNGTYNGNSPAAPFASINRSSSLGSSSAQNSSSLGSSSTTINSQKNNGTAKMTNLLDYYPDAHNDGIALTWDHAVNSQSLLEQSLNSDSLLIEADVSLMENTKFPIPIMAHPPHQTSDLTLDSFLRQIIDSSSTKGIKLDFKSTRVVEPAFRCLAKHYADLQNRPLILNADIVAGDYPTPNQPVDAWTFLMLSSTRFPKAVISIGWTIQVNEQYLSTGYSRKMIDQMLAVIKQYNIQQNALTFAVNASLMKVSIENLEYLLQQTPNRNSSLTIFAHHTNPLSLNDLIMFRQRFSPNQLYFDIPKQLFVRFRSETIRQSELASKSGHQDQ